MQLLQHSRTPAPLSPRQASPEHTASAGWGWEMLPVTTAHESAAAGQLKASTTTAQAGVAWGKLGRLNCGPM